MVSITAPQFFLPDNYQQLKLPLSWLWFAGKLLWQLAPMAPHLTHRHQINLRAVPQAPEWTTELISFACCCCCRRWPLWKNPKLKPKPQQCLNWFWGASLCCIVVNFVSALLNSFGAANCIYAKAQMPLVACFPQKGPNKATTTKTTATTATAT